MNKNEFMQMLGKAYSFPGYYSFNLDSAEEIIEDIKEEDEKDRLSLKPFFDALLAQEPEEERRNIWVFLTEHFVMEE